MHRKTDLPLQQAPREHASVIAELDELESLVLLMLTADLSVIALESRRSLYSLAYRVINIALDKAHGCDSA